MTAIGAVGASSGVAQKNDVQALGQDQFMTLMLAQLKNQDPMKPLEPAEFLGQLAQFSTVSGIQEMKGAVTDMAGAMRATQALQGASLIGRQVLAVTDRAHFDGLTSVEGSIDPPAGASSIDLLVKDSTGAIVRRMSLPAQDGVVPFAWDGRLDRGSMATRGDYTLAAIANFDGSSESAAVSIQSRVTSVSLDPATGAISLDTDHGTLGFSAVRRVK